MRKFFGMWLLAGGVGLLGITGLAARAQTAATPDIGGKAQDFTLATPDGKPVSLSALLKKGDVALVFLRGFPGYQCPYCQKQVHDLAKDADKFAAKKITLFFVYPGAASQLDDEAKAFLGKAGDLPTGYQLVTDPDYKVTTLYGLRWDAPKETAYPSTFLIAKDGKVLYRKISHTHGDRASTEDILAAKP